MINKLRKSICEILKENKKMLQGFSEYAKQRT